MTCIRYFKIYILFFIVILVLLHFILVCLRIRKINKLQILLRKTYAKYTIQMLKPVNSNTTRFLVNQILTNVINIVIRYLYFL